jgi:hypothetical protein
MDFVHSSFIIQYSSLFFGGSGCGSGCDIHDLQKGEDERREKVLSVLGLRIARFGNDEVVRDVSAVVGKIRELI